MTDHKANQAVRLYPGKWAQLGSFNRQGPYLNWFPASSTFNPLTPTDVQFGPAIQLTGYWFESDPVQPGETLPVLLQWTASQPPPADFTVFVHLVAPDGSLAAQSDAAPTWLTPTPTSQWTVSQSVLDFFKVVMQAPVSMLISGGRSSGKTTLAGFIVDLAPPSERTVVVGADEISRFMRVEGGRRVVLEAPPGGETNVRDLYERGMICW